MAGIMRHIVVLALALAGAGPSPADETLSPIPPINFETVAALSGLDRQTLALAEVTDQQRRQTPGMGDARRGGSAVHICSSGEHFPSHGQEIPHHDGTEKTENNISRPLAGICETSGNPA